MGEITTILDRMENKLDKVMIVSAKNEEHLKRINGNCALHWQEIQGNQKEIDSLKGYINKSFGAIAAFVVIVKLFFLKIGL